MSEGYIKMRMCVYLRSCLYYCNHNMIPIIPFQSNRYEMNWVIDTMKFSIGLLFPRDVLVDSKCVHIDDDERTLNLVVMYIFRKFAAF